MLVHHCSPSYVRSLRLTTHLKSYSQAANKTSLFKLRKCTGLTFSMCREALQKNNNDFDEALAWLKEAAVSRGLLKAGKLSGRTMTEGLLGVVQNRHQALIVEVNCESDFVARNASFQNLVAKATEMTMENFPSTVARLDLNSTQLSQITSSTSGALSDLMAAAVLSTGENIGLRRAVGLSLTDESSRLAVYSHMSTEGIKQGIKDVQFGKYASIIRYSPIGNKPANDGWHERAARLGRQICQHIVAMNPNPSLEAISPPSPDPDEEKHLLWQPFFLDESIKVGEHLSRNEMSLKEFVRVQCGQEESADTDEDTITKQQQQTDSSSSAATVLT